MPRQRSETVNRHSERHNPIGTPQGRTRTDSSQTGTSSNGSSHFSSKSNLRNKNSSNNLNHIPNSPHRSSNFSPAPDRLQHQQYASHHPQGFQSDSTDNSMQIDSVANPPAVLQRMVYGRGGAGQNGHQRERTTTSGSMTPISLEGFPSRDGWDQVHDQYLSRIQLKRDKSLVTPSMYHGTLYNLCLAQGLDETAEQIRLEAGNEQEEEWRGSGVSKWGTNSFQLERIEDVNENSSSKDRSKRYFFLMAGCPVEGWVLINSNEGKAVVAPDSVFSVLNWCHDKSGHGGRDKTHGLLRKYFANVPKELCQTYVKICPTCNNKRHNTMAHVRNAEDGHFEYGQDGEVDMLVDDRTPSVFTGGMPAPPPQDHRHHHHHRQEGGVNINDWSSSMSQQREFHGPRFPFNGQQSSNSLGLETGVPAVAFLPPSPFHSSNSLHQNGMQGHHQHSNQLAYPQLYFQDAPEHLGGSFLHQNAGLGQGVNEVHRGSFSGSGSGSESTGPNTPASQMDLNWPKDMDTTIATPFFGEVGQMDSHAQKSNQFGGKESMGPPPAPFGFQDDQQHRSVSTTYLDFSDAGPSHSTVVKPSMHRANKPAQLDLSSIQNQVMDLENNFQSYGLPTTCSSISTNSEASIYSAVTEPSIQYRPLLDGADEAETGRVSSSELLPRRFDINNPPSSAPPAQSHFFPNAPDDTLREMQEQRSRERAVLSAAAASGKGKHASLNQGFGGNGSNEEYLPAHRVATPLSAVPPTTTASFGPTYGAVFGNVVGGTGNLFRGQGRGKDGKIESDLMPVTAYGAPDLTVYLNPAYGIPGMSGESMVKSFSAPGTTSQPAGDEGASQIEPPSKSPNFNPSRVGNGSHFMSAPPDLLRRHSVAVEQAVVPETSSSLVSIGMSSEAAGLGHRSISKTTSQSGAATQAQLLERSWNQGASMDKEARENGHGRERARHESFEPLSAASSETDLKEIAKLNGLSKSQSADGSFYYDASAMHGPVDFTTQLNNNLELNLSMARGIDSSSVQFPQAGDEGMEDASPDGNSSVSNEDMMLSLKNAWLAGTDSTANMMAKAKESFLEKASSLGIGLGFPSVNFNEGNTSTSSESENGDSSRGTIRVLRNSSIQSSHGGRSASSSSTSSGFQPARARCSSTTKVDKADVQVELNGVSKNYNSLTQSPRSSSSAYGSMRSHSRRVSKQTADKTNDENSNVDLLDPNELMSADELNQLLS